MYIHSTQGNSTYLFSNKYRSVSINSIKSSTVFFAKFVSSCKRTNASKNWGHCGRFCAMAHYMLNILYERNPMGNGWQYLHSIKSD